MIPPPDKLVICFAHAAYRLEERFAAERGGFRFLRDAGIRSFGVRDAETLLRRIGEADVLVISELWRDELLNHAARLRFIQAIGAADQFPREELARRRIRLARAYDNHIIEILHENLNRLWSGEPRLRNEVI